MLLSSLYVDPQRFQMRDKPYSDQTVSGIVGQGINLTKFGSLPVIDTGDGRYCIAGDGHSRYEAVVRLAAKSNLPVAWMARPALAGDGSGEGWDIPCRIVSADEAKRLAWTGNLSRDNFTACEEARVFQAMLDSGTSLADVAGACHRTESHITKTLPLNALCLTIRAMVGMPTDAGGLTIESARELGAKCLQYRVGFQEQQHLYHSILKNIDLTPAVVRQTMDQIGAAIKGGASSDEPAMLFALPVNAPAALAAMRERAESRRRAERGLQALMNAEKAGGLDGFDELRQILNRIGNEVLIQLRECGSVQSRFIGQMLNVA